MQKTNFEDKMVELSQEEMMDVSGGDSRDFGLLERLWNGIVEIFNNNNSSNNK